MLLKGNCNVLRLPFLCKFVIMRKLLFILFLLPLALSSQGNPPKNYNGSNGLTSSDITDIAQDHIGYLWMATKDNGIVRFDGSEFSLFTKNEGLVSNHINALFYAKDTLFIATDKGLSIKSSRNHFTSVSDLEIRNIKLIKEQLLLPSQQGIYIYKNKKLLPLKLHDQIDLSPVLDIAYFNNGYYIVGLKALWYVDTLEAPKKVIRIRDGAYTSLKVIQDKMFATTLYNGVQVFESNKNSFHFKNVKRITSLDVFEDQYWISTDDNGVYIYDDNFGFEKRISKYNGLKVNNIRKVFVDRANNCWLATFGNGIYKYKATKGASSANRSQVHFENIEVDYTPLDSISINSYNDVLYLRPNQNNISFSFKSVDINVSKKIEYQWTLNDIIGPWTAKNSIDFANLTPGEYTFKVQSRNIERKKSNPIQFSFFIDTPMYKKKWFVYTSIGSISSILILVVLLLVRNMKRKNAKKIKQLELENHLLSLEQKALQLQMNPHFIFNVLNNIKALGGQEKMTEMNAAINNFAQLLRGILHNSRKEEVSLQQEIDTLKKYVSLEQQISGKSFEFVIDTDSISLDLDEILIPSMLIQPFVENSIKHGIKSVNQNGVITLSFEIKDVYLICVITDNGIGYKQSKKEVVNTNHESVALKVTEERIQNISGKQSFYMSEIVQKDQVLGTKIWFRIPLKTEF